MAESKPNVVLFPFMAQGHIIPFLAFAHHLERTTKFSITFLNTPLNVAKLRSSLPANSPIRLLAVPFYPADHGLPPSAENTDSLPYPLVIRLLHASLSLRHFFKQFLIDLRDTPGQPLCVLADIFFGWTASVCKELGVFHAIFSGASGYGLGCYYSCWMNLPHRKVDSDAFLLPDFPEASEIHRTQLPLNISEADGSDPWSDFQMKSLPDWANSNGILFNTVREFDQIGLSYFRRKLNLPVWAVGPVLLSEENRSKIKENGIQSENCKNFLNAKPPNSVLYVSFGSMNTISSTQMMQLAMALEKSGKNFIWVVRPPLGNDINSPFDAEKWLPEGFEKKMKDSGRGLLVRNWAPQVEILSHKAVSSFISHCGWNSTLEALTQGIPLLGWPMAAEQFFNCKMLVEEVGVCVELARGKGCEIKSGDLAKKIELVMGATEKGVEMRRKAGEVKEMIKNATRDEVSFKGSSVEGLDDFFKAAFLFREDKNCRNQNSH